jgi:hypothetical protein
MSGQTTRLTSLVIVLLASCALAVDKEIEKLYTDRALDCGDIAKNSSRLIPEFYSHGRRDSACIVLKYWEDQCGMTPSVIRAKWLMAMDSGTYNDSLLTRSPMGALINHRWSHMYNGFNSPERRSYISATFDSLMTAIADSLAARRHDKSSEALLSSFFSSKTGSVDSLFPKLQTNEYRNTPLGVAYHNYAMSVRDSRWEYITVLAGGWLPTGNRTYVGNHPDIGMAVGMCDGKDILELELSVGFLNAQRDYVVKYKNAWVATDNFTLVRIQGNYGRQVYRSMRKEFDLLIGLGAQGLIAITSNNDSDNDKGKEFSSMVGMLGAQFKMFLNDYSDTFIGLQGRWEMSKINTEGGTDLTGSAFALRLVVGFGIDYSGSDRNTTLKMLQYKYKD